ncbi:MAG: ABC transporter permease [Thermoproteus sp.]
MKFWKALRLYVKQIYSKWLLAVMASIVLMDLSVVVTSRGETYRGYLLTTTTYYVLLLLLLELVSSLAITKSDIDFTFATPADPLKLHLMRSASLGVFYFSFLFASTFPGVKADAPLYFLNLLLTSAFLSAVAANSLLYPLPRRALYIVPTATILALGFLEQRFSPLYGLVDPNPLYSAYNSVLLAVALATTPRRRVEDLATNAYGVLGEPFAFRRAGRIQGGGLPKTFWGAVWATSINSAMPVSINTPQGRVVYMRRVNMLKVLVPASAAGAVVYYVVASYLHDITDLITASSLSYYLFFLVLFIGAGSTLRFERLWISLSADPARYIKYRMFARTAIAAAVTSPWIAAYGAQSLYFKPAVFLALALIATVLIIPAASWLLSAVVEMPQIRELGVEMRPMKFGLRTALLPSVIFLALLALTMMPYGLSVAAMYLQAISDLLTLFAAIYSAMLLAASAAFFYYVVVSPRGFAVWSWFINELSERGYV